MRSKIYFAAAVIALNALASCGGNDNADVIDKSLITPGSEKRDSLSTVNTGNNNTIPNAVPASIPGITPVTPGAQPVNLLPQNTMQVNPATTATTTAPGMNPPHGQPGHRCDIAVGAPLNSKPAPATTQPAAVTTQPQQVTMTEVPNTQKTAPGMNPPHGQPGHRCDIAVGAPLNSKPAQATTQPTAVTTQPQQVTTTAVPSTQKTAPGMNPPHGEPNHRCDIAVGAPLNSKPAPATQTGTPPLNLTAPKTDTTKN